MSDDLRALEWYAIEQRHKHPMNLARVLEVRCRWDGGMLFRFARSTHTDGPWYCELAKLRRGQPAEGELDVEWTVLPMWARPVDNVFFDGDRPVRAECPTCASSVTFTYFDAAEAWANQRMTVRI